MKTLSFVLLLMASLVFVLLGCSDNSEPITGPNDQALPMSLTATPLAKGGDVVGSVSGQGRYFVSISGANAGNLVAARLALSGVKLADGSCSGKYEMDYLDAHNRVTLRIYGTIKGIKFYGNVAMLWGEVQSEFYVDIFGPQVWKQIMIVTDNGEGKKTVPDRVSNPWLTNDVWWPGEFDLFWGYTAEQFLVEMPINLGGTGSDYPLIQGNFQVKMHQ